MESTKASSHHADSSGSSSPRLKGQRQPTAPRMQQVERADIPRGLSDTPLTENALISPQFEEANAQDGSMSPMSRMSCTSAPARLSSDNQEREVGDLSPADNALSETISRWFATQPASSLSPSTREVTEKTPNYALFSQLSQPPPHAHNSSSEGEKEQSESEGIRIKVRSRRQGIRPQPRSVPDDSLDPSNAGRVYTLGYPPSSRRGYHTRVEDTEDEEFRHHKSYPPRPTSTYDSDWESDESRDILTSNSGDSAVGVSRIHLRPNVRSRSRSPNPFAPRNSPHYPQPLPPSQYIPRLKYGAPSPYVPTHHPIQYGQDNYGQFHHRDPPYNNNIISSYNYPQPLPDPSYGVDSRPILGGPPLENTKAEAAIQVEAVSAYKPPVSSDASAHALSIDISLKSSSSRVQHNQHRQGKLPEDEPSTNGEGVFHWKSNHSLLRRCGKGRLTKIQSLELYTDQFSRDRITMIQPSHDISTRARCGPKLFRWLHLEQQTLCLDDLRKLTFDCPFLDTDLKSLAEGLLQQHCTKSEKRYSNGVHSGHYIEHGTVLRCDSKHDQALDQKEESVIFCSAPYLRLDKQERQGHDIRDSEEKIHPTRTLMESLYDYELMENRDDRQAILRCSSLEQENILYAPQIWYLLCGSDVLISCSQLSLADLWGDSIRSQKQMNRSLVAIITDLDQNQFSVSLKTTDSYYSAIRKIDSLRSNVDNNPSYEYNFVLDTGEHLTPKKWLDIVELDPLPLLKMQMSPRADSNSNSRALIVLEKKPEAIEEKKLSFSFSGEGELSDNQLPATLHNVTQHPRHKTETQPLALVLRDPRFPPPGDTSLATYGPAYPLTSYTGTGSSFDAEASKSGMVRSKPAGDASEDESTLIGSVMSRQVNDLQRINALKSQGIVVNDVDMVRKVPEVFGIASSEMEPADSGPLSVEKTSKPNVWDYLDEQGDSEQDSTTLNSRVGAKRDAEASKMSRNDICMHHSSRKPQTPPTPVEARAPDPPLIPFFHWDKNKTAGMGSDVMVRQVLDEVHHRLLENNDHWRVYKRGSEITLEDLQTSTIDSLYAPSSDNIRDSILDFRSKTSNTRKHGLFNAVKFLVKLFIPLNFEHDMTKKLWGAMNKICQTLDGILNSTSEDSFIAFQTQDYTDDRDLIECLRIPDLQRPMRNCARCQSRFMTLEEGLRHLDEEHFASNIGIDSEYSAETRQLYLRTAFQIETEARLNAFLSLIEGCTKAFMELGKNAEDMLVGTLRLGDHVETQGGYPIIESLVKVFEHFTIILVFSADFMAKADKTMRTDRQRALDCGKFAIKLRGSLNQIIRRAQKDLDQARRDIILASNTDYGTETLASIGPEFMIALVSNGLFFRRLENASGKSSGKDSSAPISDRDKTTIDASELYKRYANKLQLQVNQRPQKRLLPDIYALEEELEILQKVVHWQMKFCHDFYRVLDPESYRITTKTRLSHFNHERRYLHRTIDRLKVRSAEFTSLLVRSARLRDQLQQSIEIEEESHGNAIRVFTFVTLFFLPLSFVTSFFGMNTVDIRDSDQTQAIFWIASIPTTAVVLGLAYIYGYKWESWQDRRRSAGYARRIKERGNRALRSAAALADSAGLWGSSANDLEKGGMTRRETDMSVLSQNPVRKERGKHVRFWESRSDNDDNARL